jgi:hypothetical protein
MCRSGSVNRQAIGGYFDLEFPAPKGLLYSDAVNFQSARAAFLALLRVGRPRRVWMAYYTCRTMLASLRQAGIQVCFYSIDQHFRIVGDISLRAGDWVVYTNYFGVCTDYAASVIERFGRQRVVIDASQALFSGPFDCLATIYSPRKFLGVPDGGLLISDLPVNEPAQVDEGSFERSIPLLKRAAFSPECAYADHRRAEMTLFDQEPAAMSTLTRRVLESIDYAEVRRKRSSNFSYLHRSLGQKNCLKLDLDHVDGPMCYPFFVDSGGLREALIAERIYVPTYWNDVLEHVSSGSAEVLLVERLVPLPCDQRYGEDEMARVVNACLAFRARVAEGVMEIEE